MPKILLGILIGVAACGLSAAAIFAWSATRAPDLLVTVEGPNGEWFALFAEYPAGDYDPSWHIYRFPSEAAFLSTPVKSGFGNGAIIETYEEGGDHDGDASLEILSDRYLVFSKAGMFHALYDTRCEQSLFSDSSPWNSARSAFGDDRRVDDPEWPRFYLQWKLANLHEPIRMAIATAKPCAA